MRQSGTPRSRLGARKAPIRSAPLALLLLVAAFAGDELMQQAYAEAVARKYRFYSYGDAMLVLR